MSLYTDQASQIINRTGIASTATVLSANTGRRFFIVQNLGQNPLFVKFGSGATTSDFDVVLKAGTANDDGVGGSITSDIVVYTGVISVAGTSPRYTATEM